MSGSDERQPLLAKVAGENDRSPGPDTPSSSNTLIENESACVADIQDDTAHTSFVSLFSSLLADSIPVTLSYILQNSIQTVSVLVTGRLGPHELSVCAFSFMLAMAGWCVALGGTTALDTLGSQAFTGSDRPSVSVHFQRCLVLLWLLFIPVMFLWAYMEPVLLVLGQEARLSQDVQTFLRILIVGAPGYIGFESLKKYLQCQGIMRASTYVLIAVSPINLLLNIYLVHYTPLGLLGSPVAISITFWLCFGSLIAYTCISPTHRENGTWTSVEMSTLHTILNLPIPGIFMVGTEWAVFEIVALAAGRLGALPLAAQSAIMTADQILNTIPFGIGVAASTRVGNLIGAQAAQAAKQASHASAFVSVVVGVIVMAVLMVTKDVFGYLFSDDQAVIGLVSKVMPLLAIFQIWDGLAGSCGGVLRGQGRQHLGAMFNVIAYYVLALPVGITLAFRTNLGLQGLWIGQIIALTIVGLSEYAVVWLGTDWEREIRLSVERNQAEAKRRKGHANID